MIYIIPMLLKVNVSLLTCFSLSLFSGRGEEDEFISGGEDRTVRVWKGKKIVVRWSLLTMP